VFDDCMIRSTLTILETFHIFQNYFYIFLYILHTYEDVRFRPVRGTKEAKPPSLNPAVQNL
jgi:hypothetical protein